MFPTLSQIVFPSIFLRYSQLYKKYNVTYVLGRKNLTFLADKCVGKTIVHPAAHLCISSRLLASLEAVPSFAVPTRHESHVLSIGFVK